MSLLASLAVAVGEYSLSIIAIIILWIAFQVSLRRWNDLLRLPILWLKWAIPLFFLYVALSDAVGIISLGMETNIQQFYTANDAAARMVGISIFFASVADIFILLCLVDLALSSLGALGNNSRHYKIIRYSTFVIMAVLFVLAIAGLGEDESFTTDLLDGSNPDWTKTGKLYGADAVLYWIASLGLVFLAIFVLYSSMRKQQEQSLTRRFFAASLLNLLRATWEFYLAVHYDIPSNPLDFFPQYVIVVDPILYTWVTLFIFGILIGIFRSTE